MTKFPWYKNSKSASKTMKTMIRILIILVVSAFSFISCMKDDKIENYDGEVVTVADGDFSTPLPVPPIINGQVTLTAQATTSTIFSGKKSRVLGYQSGSILGPTIVVNSGENININFQNNQIGRASCRERV